MKLYKKILFYFLLLSSFPFIAQAQWQVSGGLYPVYQYEPSSSSGLQSVYLLYGMNNVNVTFTSTDSSPMSCFRYSLSALNPEAVAFEQNDNQVTLTNPEAGFGYFVEQNGNRLSYIWIIDYNALPIDAQSLAVDLEGCDCEFTKIIFDHQENDLSYYSINGMRHKIDRLYELSWQTLSWDESSLTYEVIDKTEQYKESREMLVEAPYTNTTFTLKGDQFLQFWNIPLTLTTDEYQTISVTGQAFAKQTIREAQNELGKETSDLGGSAPADISFTGYANYPITTYQAWEISRDPNFEVLEATYPDQDLQYSFQQEGTTYVRFVVSNADNSCQKDVAVFTINISESSLEVPNVFTPDSESGNNRIFKVAYKSIVKFQANVFNRWGNLLYRWNNPAEGWDGNYHGKLVPTGAYFYVIDAEGADGKKYKLKGDINVLRMKK